jgi:predicted Zn-dependent protease
VSLIVAVVALAAAGATVGVTLATRTEVPKAAVRKPPPLLLDLGVRADPEARALARAARLYLAGRRVQAGRIFARYRSVQARVGAAFAAWPDTLPRLRPLVVHHPRNAFVELHYALALAAGGRARAARGPLEVAASAQPDTLSAVRAGTLLHPNMAPGLPIFVPSFSPPRAIERLTPRRQLDALARAAATGGARAKILYGVALQRLGRFVSARRWFAAAVRAAPDDPEARVADAVGRFDKDAPQRAFSRLGPLVRVFPHAPTVRFHLGLLLLWVNQVKQAKAELRLARAAAPGTPIANEADVFLKRLGSIRTR